MASSEVHNGINSTLLTSSTLSVLDASALLLEELDLDIVEEIIERAPRSATSFPLVYRAYCQVLDEHGLSSTNDEQYYNFLLKLGVIRAPTWGERWDLFQASRQLSSHTHKLSEDVKPIYDAPSRTVASQISPTKRRSRYGITFLASASSDLDEGFEPSVDDTDVVSLLGLDRPSPRKAMARNVSRSLVGYTPDLSLADDQEAEPPIRTSTPVYAQGRPRIMSVNISPGGSSPDSPDLPPYSVSDVSHHLATDVGDDPSTPRVRSHRLSDTSYTEKWNAKTEETMMRRADDFFRLGLAGRCWDVWYASHSWLHSTIEQIDKVRCDMLLRQSLERWRAATEYQLSLPGSADAHRRISLQSMALQRWTTRLKAQRLERREEEWRARTEDKRLKDVWRRWRVSVVERRTERWKKEVSRKERHFVRARDERLVSHTLSDWYEKMRDRADGDVAEHFFQDCALRKVFERWMRQTILSRTLTGLLEAKGRQDKDNVFDTWKQRTSIVRAEAVVTANRTRKTLSAVWVTWKDRQQEASNARQFDEARIIHAAVCRWIGKKARINCLRQKADVVNRTAVQRQALHVWVTEERGLLFARVLQVRLLQSAITRWTRKLSHVREIEDAASDLAQTFANGSLHRHFSRWRAKLGDWNLKTIQAVLYRQQAEQKHLAHVYAIWRASLAENRENEITAVKARAFFVQRQAVRLWRFKLRLKAQAKWLEQKRSEETQAYFDLWYERTERSRRDTEKVNHLQIQWDARTASSVLDRWTARVVDIKSREHAVFKKRQGLIKHRALSKWINVMKRVQRNQGLGQSFLEVREEDQTRRLLVSWKVKAMRTEKLRLQAEQSMVEREDRRLRDTFTAWRDRLKERYLRETELEVASRHEDALMFAVWDRWKGRSTRLPEIAFVKRRLLKMAYGRWRNAIQDKERERSISIPRDQQLLLDVFAVWREHARKRMALSAVRRRDRVRPGQTARKVSAPEPTRNAPHGGSRSAFVPPLRPSITTPHSRVRRKSVTAPAPAREDVGSSAQSMISEPAYSRLRSELYGRYRRGGSEEPEERADSGTSELVRQLRGALR